MQKTLKSVTAEKWDWSDRKFNELVNSNSDLPLPAKSLLILLHKNNTSWDLHMVAVALIKVLNITEDELLSLIFDIDPREDQVIMNPDFLNRFKSSKINLRKVSLAECLHIFRR